MHDDHEADKTILEIKNLKLWYKVYKGYSKVLDGVNLTVRKGEKVGIVGEAGCGKTTTVKSILGIIPENRYVIPEGQIVYKGRDVLEMSERELNGIRRGEISMIYQEPAAALNPVFTIGQQMMDVVRYSSQGKDKTKKEQKEMVLRAINDVFIPDVERIFGFYPSQLSGGMKQRICIAMAIMTQRDLMIADEPGTALDVTIQDQVHRTLNELVEKRNMSLIMITHSLGVARELTDSINVMYAGSMVESAKTKEMFRRTLHPYTIGLMAAVPRLSGGGIQSGIYGSIPDYLYPPPGCRFAPRCRRATGECREQKPPVIDTGDGHLVACWHI
ncbi:ABC transporter ATP-binding protein [Desulfosporosinus fructosivorans]|uniref:ABC transporter ATP-binding protein n=1 Tax=Desulfosporosinus fructosivorans TaxID=2018669 RepID=A0A4Z0R2X8_9FIRM|nr:ABC transporter ATP-binding protein [Desulfosporosinus fructosivorans]TGE37130.1 ABC transporter ATP-binding protein [Desulfosporosinus fructosivorans]